MKSTMTLAASVLIGVAVWLGVTGGPASKAYGIEDFAQRLQTARSYHLKGWQYYEHRNPDGTTRVEKLPTQRYVGWPCMSYSTWAVNNNGTLETRYSAEDAERYIEVNDATRTCRTGRNFPFATELLVVSFLEQMPRTLMSGDPSRYRLVREETVGGIRTDVYEASSTPERGPRTRSVVWLNPRTGLPVRIAGYIQRQGQPERPLAEFDLVEVDMPPPAELFSFEPPAGYKVTREDRGPESAHNGSTGASVNSVHLDFRFEFNISDRAILACWAWYDTATEPYFEPELNNPPGQVQQMILASRTNNRKYRLVPLRDDPAEKFHWHWSLVVPEDGKPIGQDQPSFTIKHKGSTSGHACSAWQNLSRQTLADFVLKAQRLTLPADAPANTVLTLEQIEAKIAELTSQAP